MAKFFTKKTKVNKKTFVKEFFRAKFYICSGYLYYN